MSTVIKVENLSKQYRLGQVGTGTISHDVNRWWHKIRGKEDPYLKIGESNDRTVKGESDYVWALKDVNFEVQQGEVLGIIGRNGAGKSTLLKILSRTTSPTTGSVKIKGRVASLLEVGTGFHPELSGRDNIFLNGAILGMTRREIQSKFDEIVDFAGVERYIDTPVKRYSSGMYVRLAFAVAAHLEPEILIVDEVLAVGDAEFQKKCLGKMKDVSLNQGRTVLFVSHNMPAITQLCNSAVLIKEGEVQKTGLADLVVRHYIATQSMILGARYWEEKKAPGDDLVRLISCRMIQNQNSVDIVDINVDAEIEVTFRLLKDVSNLIPGINLYNIDEICVFDRCDWASNHLSKGLYKKTLKIPAQTLAEGQYSILVHLTFFDPLILSVVQKDTMFFEAIDSDNPNAVRGLFKGPWPGIVRLGLKWGEYEKFEN
jgi:lipopolysaccharide transport system ATP-binding protein